VTADKHTQQQAMLEMAAKVAALLPQVAAVVTAEMVAMVAPVTQAEAAEAPADIQVMVVTAHQMQALLLQLAQAELEVVAQL
jgi:hypothetical protein